jgi:hypothetical protein
MQCARKTSVLTTKNRAWVKYSLGTHLEVLQAVFIRWRYQKNGNSGIISSMAIPDDSSSAHSSLVNMYYKILK